jgi:xanthine dehydrogenase accessory factor
VTIVRSNGSTPQRTGAKMLVFADGRIVGTIGGGCYENDAVGRAREAIATGKPELVKYDLNDDFVQESGLICGGQMEVYIDPIAPVPSLYIVGAGHVRAPTSSSSRAGTRTTSRRCAPSPCVTCATSA